MDAEEALQSLTLYIDLHDCKVGPAGLTVGSVAGIIPRIVKGQIIKQELGLVLGYFRTINEPTILCMRVGVSFAGETEDAAFRIILRCIAWVDLGDIGPI